MAIQSVNNVIAVRAVGTGDDQTYTINRAGIVYDLVVIATNGLAGTITAQNGAAAISGALNPASTDTRAVRSATGDNWVTAQKALVAGDVLTFNNSAATLNYEAYAYIYPTLGFPA
ncbi:hypothetical protein CMI37_18890 [Candidatus Pacearchaeota archaeon]|nr:hypothetical protein [Candidatus Pacearchaeota archaeon]|tara:strand:+ start:635 stop:982 length:348 start_codon:yes stop_codon:yes gene_type:complete